MEEDILGKLLGTQNFEFLYFNEVPEGMKIANLLDVDSLQAVQDSFSELVGVAAIITDNDGNPVTKGSNFTDFCSNYVRMSPKACALCEQCDRDGGAIAITEGKANVYHCHAGLLDFAAPIKVGDTIIGSVVGGQVLTEKPDEDKLREDAIRYGINPDAYVAAASKVNIVPKEKLNTAADFLFIMSKMLSESAYKVYEQKQHIEALQSETGKASETVKVLGGEILSTLTSLYDFLEESLDNPDTSNDRAALQNARRRTRRMLAQISDITDYTKIESGEQPIAYEAYDVIKMINDVCNYNRDAIEEKKLNFGVNIAENIPHKLIGDSKRLSQVINEILVNSIKFTEEGRIMMTVTFNRVGDKKGILRVDISDTGAGIKEEEKCYVFDLVPVEGEVAAKNRGARLGSVVAKKLINLMGGDIQFDSVYGVGTSFFISIEQEIAQ